MNLGIMLFLNFISCMVIAATVKPEYQFVMNIAFGFIIGGAMNILGYPVFG